MIEENHTLIAGMTGSGKSVLENDIIYALLCNKFPAGENGAKFILIDPKKVELNCYKNLPHTILYADEIDTIVSALNYVRQIIDDRLNTMKRAGERKFKGCPIYVIIDELVDLMTSAKSKEITRLIADSISIARATGVYFLMLTQAPNRKILRAEIVLNASCRCALYCRDPQESRQIIGDSSACDLPPHGLGIVQNGLDRYQIAIPMYKESEINDIIRHWTKQHPIINALQRRKTKI
jgi:S-DNA-T family DNA segregation ATPase FtsK/SpoIIIE